MHVAFLAPAWPLEGHPNGIVTYVHWMRDELRRQGHRVSVLTARRDGEDDGVRQVRDTLALRSRRWFARRRAGAAEPYAFSWAEMLAAELNRLHRQEPIDVIEMEESFGWAGTVQARVPVPVVVKLHGPAFLSLVAEDLSSDFARLKIEREGAALAGSRVITSPSSKTLEATLKRYALAPAIGRHVVNPLELPSDALLWNLDACDRRTILFVGRFDQRKGGDLVLEAFAALWRKDPSLRLVFVGPDAGVPNAGGTKLRLREAMAQRLPADAVARVEVRGAMAPAEIYRLRAGALVTVVASRWENQSYTALEAMLQGCPLVSSDAGGQPEFVIDGLTGLLAHAGDAADLALKIGSLLADPESAATLGRQARSFVLERHSPSRVVRQTLAVYRDAVELSRAARA